MALPSAEIHHTRKTYASLGERLVTAAPNNVGAETIQTLKIRFREHIFRGVTAIDEPCSHCECFEEWPTIRALRIMMDYAPHPVPEDVGTMPLNGPEEPTSKSGNFTFS